MKSIGLGVDESSSGSSEEHGEWSADWDEEGEQVEGTVVALGDAVDVVLLEEGGGIWSNPRTVYTLFSPFSPFTEPFIRFVPLRERAAGRLQNFLDGLAQFSSTISSPLSSQTHSDSVRTLSAIVSMLH